jgi:hypothetical protein
MRWLLRLILQAVLMALTTALVIALGVVGVFILQSTYSGWRFGQTLVSPQALADLGAQGEFLGGHLGTLLSALTLALLVYTTYTQSQSSRLESARSLFSSGIDAIARYDTSDAACPPAMRLLDYYSRLALQHRNREFYHLLNTVMTSEIRNNLEKQGCPYRYAITLRDKIMRLNELAGLRQNFGWIKGTWRYARKYWII